MKEGSQAGASRRLEQMEQVEVGTEDRDRLRAMGRSKGFGN